MQVITPAPRAVWEQVFDSDPHATPFQSPHWMQGIVDTGRFTDQSRLYVTPTSRIILPLVGYRMAPFVDAAVSLPRGFGLGGMLSDSSSAPIIDEILANLSRSSFRRISIRSNPLSVAHAVIDQPHWRTVRRTSHVLCLSGGTEAVFERMQARKRSAIRKALRAGFELEYGSTKRFVDTYYEVFMRWCENKGRQLGAPAVLARWVGTHVEPYRKFLHMAAAMGDSLRIYVASVRGRAVASSILVLSKCSAAYWRGASDLALPAAVGANDLLQGEMIQDACAAGCASYHMGHSGELQSLIDYKERLGARGHDYAEYILESFPIAAVSNAASYGYGQITAMLGRLNRERVGANRSMCDL